MGWHNFEAYNEIDSNMINDEQSPRICVLESTVRGSFHLEAS